MDIKQLIEEQLSKRIQKIENSNVLKISRKELEKIIAEEISNVIEEGYFEDFHSSHQKTKDAMKGWLDKDSNVLGLMKHYRKKGKYVGDLMKDIGYDQDDGEDTKPDESEKPVEQEEEKEEES